MAITLRITFIGMFTFVPVATEASRKLVALLPRTGLKSTGEVHQHHALMVFPRSCIVDRNTNEHHSPALGAAKHTHENHAGEPDSGSVAAEEFEEICELIPLGRTRVSFEDVQGDGSDITPPSESVNLKTIVGHGLDNAQIGESPRDTVYAQVILPPADSIAEGDTAEWRLRGVPRRMSHLIVWTKPLKQDYATFTLKYIGGDDASLVRLVPLEGESTIDILVAHLPVILDDHEPQKDDPAPHFDAYYDLFDPRVTDRPLPYLNEDPPVSMRTTNWIDLLARFFAANTFTCMTSQVPID